MNERSFSRRQFLAATAVSAVACCHAGTTPVRAAGEGPKRFTLIGFTKPFQQLSPDETAEFVREVGWDGVELAVRARGHVEPERVEEDLPKFAEALGKRGLQLSLISTDVKNVSQPLSARVLRTAAKLGIQRYRLAFWKYAQDKPITAQLEEIRAELRELAAFNRELGLTAGFQNHSGADYVGAPVWDIWHLIKDLDPQQIGICFDIGHATLEGGYSWPIDARLMQPRFTAVYVKDFFWAKSGTGWKAEWCPLGEGMVNKRFFDTLKKSDWSGPISQHHEYELPSDRQQLLGVLKKDLQLLRGWLE